MPGMISQAQDPAAAGAPPPQQPAGPEEAGGEGQVNPVAAQAMLILQPVQLLYAPETAQKLIDAAQKAEPAKVLAAAAISAVTASVKAAQARNVQLDAEQIGAAVVEVIKSAAAILIAGGAITPEETPETVNTAIQYASQGGEAPPEEAGAPPAEGAPPPPQPGMAPGAPPMGG